MKQDSLVGVDDGCELDGPGLDGLLQHGGDPAGVSYMLACRLRESSWI